MASTISWSGRSHLSIEGIEVVPANELEVAYDNSPPEVVAGQWINEKKRSVALQSLRRKRIDWRRRKVFGVPLLWIAIGVITFGIGIAMGSIVVSSVVSKDSRANRFVPLPCSFLHDAYKNIVPKSIAPSHRSSPRHEPLFQIPS